MAKVSPQRNSFNGGEWSPLMQGRVDIDKYPASMRLLSNFIAAQQGPAIRRSGTSIISRSYKNQDTWLVPFEFSEEQSLYIEVGDLRIRFVFEDGLQAFAQVAGMIVTATNPLTFTLAGLGASLNDEVVFDNASAVSPAAQGKTAIITNVSGSTFTTDYTGYTGPAGAVAMTAGLVYAIVSPYAIADVSKIRYVSSVDVVYLFCDGYPNYKLVRNGAFAWTIAQVNYVNGPFMSENPSNGNLTLSATGNQLTGGTATDGGNNGAGFTAAQAFDQNPGTYWQSNVNQAGSLQYQLAAAKVCTGYAIHAPTFDNGDTTYAYGDYAPGSWTFSGSNDGTNYTVLDTQIDFVLYTGGRTPFIKINNTVAYSYYKLIVTACFRNGTVSPRVAEFVVGFNTNVTVNAVLSGTYTAVNQGQGFLATDVGRLLRVKDADTFYRVVTITAWTDATHVAVQLSDEPFSNTNIVQNWSLGYFGNTNGFPTCGVFFDDRLWLGGVAGAPNLVAGSTSGAYENFQSQAPDNSTEDDYALVLELNSRKNSRVLWISTDERGVLIGTGVEEYVLMSSSSTEAGITATNARARPNTGRGSKAGIEPVKVDSQILFVQRSGSDLREFAYVYQEDKYKAPSLAQFATHLTQPTLVQGVYAAEPFNLVWWRRSDGSMVALTYDRDENVVGWHRHDFGGLVGSLAVIPSIETNQDLLGMVINRNGVRTIEKLMPFWSFADTIDVAHYVDGGVRFNFSTPQQVIYGMEHLTGLLVDGLIDNVPFPEPVLVEADGSVPLHYAGMNIVIGAGFVSEGETTNLEAGAADGTAQGKVMRVNTVTVEVWESALGEIGVYDDQNATMQYEQIEYSERSDELESIVLKTETCGPTVMRGGYSKRGSLGFRQTRPLPFNVISLLPQLETEDR